MESAWRRSVKRKLDPIEGAGDGRGPHRSPQSVGDANDVAARVEVDYEVSALRETLASQQQTIQDLSLDLEEERNAASTAASEAMSMILRLQREKAEVQMDFRQFKRFAEEKMAHDQQELLALDDILFKREIKAYNHRLLSYGIDAGDPDTQTPQNFDLPDCDYPQLRCTIQVHEHYGDDCGSPILEMYSPTTLDQLHNLETRIYEMEAEKKAVVGSDFRLVRDLEEEFKNVEEEEEEEEDEKSSGGSDRHSEEDDDDESARVYTIDAVHSVPAAEVSNEDDDYDVGVERQKGIEDKRENVAEDEDIKKLYMRLQALEADRESMRQAIILMRTEKAQLVLLKEIARQLCKEVVPDRRKAVKNPLLISKFSFAAVVKWVLRFIFWRKKTSRSKYSFGLSNNNVGLMLLLDKSPCVNQWRCLTSTRG